MQRQGAIYAPNTVWAEAIERVKQAQDQGRGDLPDSYMFVCGPRQSGKSTLLNRILYTDKTEVPKPGTSFECSFARANIRPERKDLVHIWELCGPKELTDRAVEGERVFISGQQIATTTVLIVVDLSEPDALQQARHWVQLVHSKCQGIYDKMRREGLQTAEKLLQRAKGKFVDKDNNENEEASKVKHTGVAVTIVGAKYDKVARLDTKRLKDLNRAFRALAHANGASLAFVGGLGGTDGARLQSEDPMSAQLKRSLEVFRLYVKAMMFGGLKTKREEKVLPAISTSYEHPAFVPAGCDTTARIRAEGTGQAAGPSDPDALYRELEESYRRDFEGMPSSSKGLAEDTGPSAKDKIAEYPEAEIDVLVTELMGKFAEVQRDKERAKAALEAKRKAQMQARQAAMAQAKGGAAAGSGTNSQSMSREGSTRG